ncbi:MAG TPA: DNA primase [Thermoanaerobaculia bacterium]|nr:DNA primase [Thermoanaerobaculia bacterium]
MALANVQITPQLVQAVRDAIDIVGIASEHTRLRPNGRRMQGLCPLHKEKTPSFSVDPVQGLFYCFGCGKGGDAIKLHMLVTGDDFPAAIESLAQRYGIPLPKRAERTPGGRRERDVSGALEAAAKFFGEQLRKWPLPQRYLAERQIAPELTQRFGLGFAPDGWRNLVQALHPRLPMADLVAAGLAGVSESRGGEPYDRFRNRLMFPIHSPSGRLVGFGGRTLGDDPAKYVNTAETEQFHKGTLLYGLHLAKREIRETGRAVLVEGYFDVVGTVAAGVEGTVAGMGTALTPEQARLLSRYASEVVVAYDGDSAGENAYRRALPLLLAEGLAVRRARFPEGHDPDSLRLAAGPEAVQSAIAGAEDAIFLEMERLIPKDAGNAPRLTASAASAVRELVGAVADPVARHNYLRRAAERLRIPEAIFFAQLAERRPPERQGGARMEASPAVVASDSSGIVRGVEEQVLELLLKGQPPPLSELPPPEVFFDLQCRNIFQVFCTLYGRSGGPPPDGRAVLSELGSDGDLVDRMAQILVEAPVGSKEVELQELLGELAHRYQERRLRELASEISEAQRKGGDDALLTRLYDEKRRLSLSLHRRTRPGAGKGAG